jgi:hypothetical protein
MAYGFETYTAGGVLTSGQSMVGGRVFIGIISKIADLVHNTVTTYTYPDVPGGSYLRVYQVGAGEHSWVIGTNGSSQATVTLTSTYKTPSLIASTPITTLLVFATKTTEPSYGIETTNDAGDRIVSTLFPAPEYLGKVTFSSTPSSSWDAAEAGYWAYSHITSSSLGSGRNRIILWALTDNAGDCWFNGTTFVASSVSGAYNITAQYIRPPATSYTMPTAYVFALDGLSSSSDAYGIRVYNAAGAMTFDGGLRHMDIRAIETTLAYPTTTGSSNTYSFSSLSGTPAILVPMYQKETWVWTSGQLFSTGKRWVGGVRKNGTTLYSRLTCRDPLYEDNPSITGTVYWGQATGLMQAVVDASVLP